jgi:tetratricopeptide (TPR) repeat protein
VYDNVEDPNLKLGLVLPKGEGCSVIVTSRNYLHHGFLHLPLAGMSEDEALELLQRDGTLKDEKEASAIAAALGYLPVALEQAHRYIFETGCANYLERLSTNMNQLLGREIQNDLGEGYRSTIAAFRMSFDRLDERHQKALLVLSFFDRNDFPLSLIEIAAENNFSDYAVKYIQPGARFANGKALLKEAFDGGGEWNIMNLDDMIKSFQNYSFVTLAPFGDTTLLSMHSLLQRWLQSYIPERDKPKYESAAVLLLALGARDEDRRPRFLANHVVHLCNLWDKLHINDIAAFGLILSNGGMFQEASGLQKRVVTTLRDKNADGRILCNSLSYLAITYIGLGEYKEAEKLQMEVLEWREENGGDDIEIINTLSDLGGTYYRLGDFERAVELLEKALNWRKQSFRDKHRGIAITSHLLGVTYYQLGRISDSKALLEEALALSKRKEVFGERHPCTLRVAVDLSSIYRSLGLLPEAEKLQVDVLRVCKEVLGERHIDTIRATCRFAYMCEYSGRLHEAEALLVEMLRLSKKELGARHPTTIWTSYGLAVTYWRRWRFSDAAELLVEVLRGKKEAIEGHPSTTEVMAHLCIAYMGCGKIFEGLRVEYELLYFLVKTRDRNGPDTRWFFNNPERGLKFPLFVLGTILCILVAYYFHV